MEYEENLKKHFEGKRVLVITVEDGEKNGYIGQVGEITPNHIYLYGAEVLDNESEKMAGGGPVDVLLIEMKEARGIGAITEEMARHLMKKAKRIPPLLDRSVMMTCRNP